MNVIWIYHYTLNLQKQFSQFAHFSMWCVLALTPRFTPESELQCKTFS